MSRTAASRGKTMRVDQRTKDISICCGRRMEEGKQLRLNVLWLFGLFDFRAAELRWQRRREAELSATDNLQNCLKGCVLCRPVPSCPVLSCLAEFAKWLDGLRWRACCVCALFGLFIVVCRETFNLNYKSIRLGLLANEFWFSLQLLRGKYLNLSLNSVRNWFHIWDWLSSKASYKCIACEL